MSDSFAITIEVPELKPWDFSIAFLNIVANAGFIVEAALNEGFAVRGALEVGDLWWNDKEVVGPPLVQAIAMEKETADSARVLVGPNILSDIARTEDPKAHHPADGRGSRHYLHQYADGRLGLKPRILFKSDHATSQQKLSSLREGCSKLTLKEKYDELIAALSEPPEAGTPTLMQVWDAEKILRSSLFTEA